jgi:branched-chain amino acid transport system permease protein
VPVRWGEVPAILFGLGAIGIARNPEGAVVQAGRQLRGLLTRFLPHGEPVGVVTPAIDPLAPGEVEQQTADAGLTTAGAATVSDQATDSTAVSGSTVKAKR